ncbi:MAG: hypothetical protein ACT4TC_13255 [Myxococcaceae bacterium]
MASPSSIVRGAWLGLCASLFVGGLALLGLAARVLLGTTHCDGLSQAECSLEREVSVSFVRRQAFFGGLLALLGLGLFSLLRSKRSVSTTGV